MDEIIEIINEVIKYGLSPNLKIEDSEKDIENNLIKLYSKYFDINYEFDNTDYPEFENEHRQNIISNVTSNFPDFSIYHEVLNCHKFNKEADNAMGHAIDDISDIIIDLLEIKWRSENNREQDALWFFELLFKSHTQQHILSLLNFIKSKNG